MQTLTLAPTLEPRMSMIRFGWEDYREIIEMIYDKTEKIDMSSFDIVYEADGCNLELYGVFYYENHKQRIKIHCWRTLDEDCQPVITNFDVELIEKY